MRYILFLSAILYSLSAGAKIEVSFAPKSVRQGDSVELILSSDKPFQGVPDLTVLEQDFVIGGQQQKRSSQWVNGRGSDSYQLIYTLFPNKSGDITVKGLKIGSETLPETTLKVSRDAAYEQTGSLALSVECPHKALYPEQKLLCQITLDDTMGLVDGELVPPESSSGTWEQLLPLVPTRQSTEAKRNYQGVFAFTPNQSGKIEVPPFTFKGAIRLNTRSKSNSFSMIDFMILSFRNTATKPVAVQSKPLTFNVKEKPNDYQGWWLPSTKVTLREQYDIPNPLHVGEPITRTLILSSPDVDAANLPVPSVAQTPGFKIYANPEQRNNQQTGAELTVALTFVPTQSGALTLPAITVPWFNTQTETIQEASVPTKDIVVTAEAIAPSDTTPTPINAPVQPDEQRLAQPQSNLDSTIPTETQETPVTNSTTATIPWFILVAAIGLAFIGGILVALFILKKHQNTDKNAKKKKPLPDLYPF